MDEQQPEKIETSRAPAADNSQAGTPGQAPENITGQDQTGKKITATEITNSESAAAAQGVDNNNLPDLKQSKNNKPEIKALGKRNLSAVFLSATEEEKKEGKKGRVIEFSDQEAMVLRIFLDTHNYEAVAKECEIKVESVKRILRRPNLKRYLEEIIAKTAIKLGTDEVWCLKELRYVWEGQLTPSPIQMEAMKIMGKILVPRGPGIVINNQQNSVYSGMNREAINAEWADARAAAVEGI